MVGPSRPQLRRTFGEDTELYDRCRPGYPSAMVDDLRALTGIGTGSRALEIGCGNGSVPAPGIERWPSHEALSDAAGHRIQAGVITARMPTGPL